MLLGSYYKIEDEKIHSWWLLMDDKYFVLILTGMLPWWPAWWRYPWWPELGLMPSGAGAVCVWHRRLRVGEYNLVWQHHDHFCWPPPRRGLGWWRNSAEIMTCFSALLSMLWAHSPDISWRSIRKILDLRHHRQDRQHHSGSEWSWDHHWLSAPADG